MRILLPFIMIFGFCLSATAQNQTFSLQLKESKNASAHAFVSDVISLQQGNTGMVSVSAFTGISQLAPLFFYCRVQTNEGWENWQIIRQDDHKTDEDVCIAFGPYIIEKELINIQFAMDFLPQIPIQMRLYYPLGENTKAAIKSTSNPYPSMQSDISQCTCPQPSYCNRSCWCPSGNCPYNSSPAWTTPSHLIVHHSAGNTTSNNFPAVVKSYWDYHVNTRGWSDIGYNWLIDGNGVVYEGRPTGQLGAHFNCTNQYTVGICLIGNYETNSPTTAILESLKNLLAFEGCVRQIEPAGASYHAGSQLNLDNISGHRDGNSSPVGCPAGTLCPGANVYNMLGSIANQTAAKTCFQAPANSGPAPNMAILELFALDDTLRAGEPHSLRAKITNTGDTMAFSIHSSLKINGATFFSDVYPALGTGFQVTYTEDYIFPTAGTYSYCINIDSVAGEVNWANNSYCVDLHVLPAVGSALRPNMVVSELQALNDTLRANDTILLNAKITNIGDSIASNVLSHFTINSIEYTTEMHPSLAPSGDVYYNHTYVFPTAGNYTYCIEIDSVPGELVLANNSYCIDLNILSKENANGMEEFTDKIYFNVYPNPSKGILYLQSVNENTTGKTEVELFNVQGQIISSTRFTGNHYTLNAIAMPKGLYFIRLTHNNFSQWNKLVLE